MLKSLLLSVALAGASLAQNQAVLTLLLPPGDVSTRLVGSVITADATATSLSVNCVPSTKTSTAWYDYCQVGDSFDARFAGSSVVWHMTQHRTLYTDYLYAYTMSVTCTFTVSTRMTCTGTTIDTTIDGTRTSSWTSRTTQTMSSLSSLKTAVTMTAGAEKLTQWQATPTPAAGGSQSTAGAMPRITQNAVLAGVAAVVGGGMAML